MIQDGEAIRGVTYREVVRPLRTTFSTSLGSKKVMSSVMVRVCLNDGSVGIGECPTSLAIADETVPAIKSVIKEIIPFLKKRSAGDYTEVIPVLRARFPRNPMTISGLEVALFRAWISSNNIDEHSFFGGKLGFLETDITVPFARDVVFLGKWMNYAVNTGFSVFKIKVGGNLNEDNRLVERVVDYVKDHMPAFVFRFDGNQGFTTKSYLAFIDIVMKKGYPIELFEQPLPKTDYRGLKEITQRSPVPIILDETVFTVSDLTRVIDDSLGDGINIKVAKSGITESIKLYKLAKKAGLQLMIGCMTETMAGISAGINIAAGLGGFDYIDLDGVHFLHHGKNYGAIKLSGPRYLLSHSSC